MKRQPHHVFDPDRESRPRLAISFSGGRTSAYMTKMLLETHKDTHDIAVSFANTGCEHPATLDFINNCDKHFGFNTVWLEAVVTHDDRVGIRHQVVDYKTASRDGEPFRQYIGKYGIPNMATPTCTSRLKEDVLWSYRHRELGWEPGSYDTAIGIRADEADRMSQSAAKHRFVYPLVGEMIRKRDVLAACKQWPFDLELPGEHYGNCVWCWKKSLRKLLTVAKHNPEFFDFPAEMDSKYSKHRLTPPTTSPQGDRRFFRKHMNTADILKMAREGNFEEYSEAREFQHDLFDVGLGCSESCEVGVEEMTPRPVE